MRWLAARRPLGTCAGLLALLCCQPTPVPQQAAPLSVAIEGTYPPFSFVGADRQLHGFEPDLARHVCAAMGAQCKLTQIPFDAMLPGLMGGRHAFAFASIQDTPQRRQQVRFSRPYLLVGSAAATYGAVPLPGQSALADKIIGVQRGTTHEQQLAQMGAQRVRRYGSYPEAGLDLRYGRIDLLFGDAVSIAAMVATAANGHSPLQVVDQRGGHNWVGPGHPISAALSPAYASWLPKIDAALQKVVASGDHARLIEAYFPNGGVTGP